MKFHAIIASGLIALPGVLFAQGGQVVGPNGISSQGNPTNWQVSQQAGAYAQVTTTYQCGTALSGPCSGGYANVGDGALELSVTGNGNINTGYPDWAFYYLYAGGTAENTINGNHSFGNLAELSSLSFDWFRKGLPGWDAPVGSVQDIDGKPITPADWAYKTPVVRLQLREYRDGFDDVLSELVWEGYYNQCSLGISSNCADNKTPVDQWVSQTGMQNDAFWYVRPPAVGGTAGYTQNGSCSANMSFWEGGVDASNPGSLFGDTGCLFGARVDVIGIAVGVGSQWPLPWEGAVDNVRMGFDGQNELAVNTNFDFVRQVPEPSAWLLVVTGAVAMAVVARRRRSSQAS